MIQVQATGQRRLINIRMTKHTKQCDYRAVDVHIPVRVCNYNDTTYY